MFKKLFVVALLVAAGVVAFKKLDLKCCRKDKSLEAQIRDVIAARSRMSEWDGTRATMTTPPDICPLTPERRDDWLRFFDRDAFMDNPMWADCYCMFYRFSGTNEEWEHRTAKENREDQSQAIRGGEVSGLLAYGFWTQVLVSGIRVAAPLFFSGIIFAHWFQRSNNTSAALGSNLMGSVVGGLSEYSSLALGLRDLYLLAILFYGLSFALTVWPGLGGLVLRRRIMSREA